MPESVEPFGNDEDRQPLTAGERLLRAFAQLRLLHVTGRLPCDVTEFDVADVARIIGVHHDLEFVTEDAAGQHYHFPGEVLYVNLTRAVPYRLFTLEEWSARSELGNYSEDRPL